MMDSMKIIYTVFVVLLLGTMIGLSILFQQHKKHEAFLKDCFMQEYKTKECEYILWKYENRTKSRSAIVPMPVVVR